jgi:hypothetical protein
MAYPSLLFQPPTFNIVFQKGALYDDDSSNRGDESFSSKSQGEEMNLVVINPRDLKLQTHPLCLLRYLTVTMVREWI